MKTEEKGNGRLLKRHLGTVRGALFEIRSLRLSFCVINAALVFFLIADQAQAVWYDIRIDPASMTNTLEIVSGKEISTILLGEGEGETGTTVTTNETEATEEIQALARALQNDPKLMYEYVRNHIDYVNGYGVVNGATGCLLAGRGNDWDQSALLASLLRVAGYTNRFVMAKVAYYKTDLANWFGVNTNLLAEFIYSSGRIGYIISLSAHPDSYGMKRVWVEANIDGNWYKFDPSFKEFKESQGVDLASAMGYSQSDFLDNATDGATVTSNYVQNVNETNITNLLTSYTTNLIHFIQTNCPNVTVEEVIGGRVLLEETMANYSTNLPKAWEIREDTRVEWEHIPETNNVSLTIQHCGIDEEFKGYEIAAKRLSIFYNADDSYKPQLCLDGELVATGNATTHRQSYDLTMIVDHPYESWSGIYTAECSLVSGSAYVLQHGFESISSEVAARNVESLRRDLESGLSEDSEAVLGGSMEVVLNSYDLQAHQYRTLWSKLVGVQAWVPHVIGFLEVANGYTIHIEHWLFGRCGPSAEKQALTYNSCIFGSALEHGILEQSQGTEKEALSTVKLLQVSNCSSNKIYFVDSNNWASVRNNLRNYTDNDLSMIDEIIDDGGWCILPEYGNIQIGDWIGVGYAWCPTWAAGPGFRISGGFNGGTASGAWQWGYWNNWFYENYGEPWPSWAVPPTLSLEPVDLHSGNFLLEHTDLRLGSTTNSEPKELRFTRFYDSGQSLSKGPLGYGSAHNYDITIKEASDGEAMLGVRQAIDVAPLIACLVVCRDLMDDESPTIRDWVCTILGAKWGMDQLTENAIIVKRGNRCLEYTRMPDGSYNPPPGVTETLTKDGDHFVMEERFDTKLTFNTNGMISFWQDADSNTVTFTYNSSNNLSSVSNSFGYTLSFSYSNDFISSISDSSGRSVSYQYSSNNLTAYTDPESKTWTYAYNDTNNKHCLTVLTDPLSQMTASNSYDALGKVESQMNGFSNVWKFCFSGYRNIEEDPEGGQTIHYFDDNGRNLGTEDALGNRTYNYYDPQGHLVSNIDAGDNATAFYYDGDHNFTNRVDALGNSTVYAYDSQHRLISVTDPLDNVTQYEYDNKHHLTNTIDALGYKTTMVYFPNGLLQRQTHLRYATAWQATDYTYDSYGNPETVQRIDGGTVTNQYNSRGDLTSLTDANGHTTLYSYDKRRLLTSATDAGWYTVSNVYDAAGLKICVIDRNGNTTSYSYTPTYNIDTVTYANGGTVVNHYNTRDWLVAVTDQGGNTTSNRYDVAGRNIRVIDALGHETKYGYDENKNVIAVTNALSKVTSLTYDALNRLVTIVDPLSHSNSIEYDALGRQVAITDENGYCTEFEHDALGRITAIIKPDSVREEFEYDSTGNMTDFENGEGYHTTFTYDGMNRMLSMTNAESDGVSYTYDNVGNKISRTDGKGATTYYYDNANNLTNITYPDSSKITFLYDGNRQATNMTDSVGTTTYSYNNMNWLTSFIDRHGNTVSYVYDLKGNRTRITYPGNLTVSNVYDSVDRLASVTDWNTNTTSYAYNDIHSLTNVSYPNSVSGTYSWDDASRLTGLEYVTNGVAFVDRNFTLDAVGNITQEDIDAGLAPVLSTPLVRRLTQNDADMLDKVYDKATPDATSWTTNSYTYDANGNLFSNNVGMSIRYDYEDMPTNFVTSTLDNQYEYDGLGDRTRRTISGTTYIDVLDRGAFLHNVLIVTDASGNPLRYYIWGRRLIAQVFTNGTIHYYHPDAQGSTLAMTDSSGNIVAQYAYSPYGEVLNSTGSVENAYTWVGGYGVRNEGDNIYHMKARYYHAGHKRFITRDPIVTDGINPAVRSLNAKLARSNESPRELLRAAAIRMLVAQSLYADAFAMAGLNQYVFCANNPVNLIDPFGLDWFRPQGEEYSIGREGTIVPPGRWIGKVIDDYAPGGHTFGNRHDAFVGKMQDIGVPDFLINIPSMPFVFVEAEVEEIIKSPFRIVDALLPDKKPSKVGK